MSEPRLEPSLEKLWPYFLWRLPSVLFSDSGWASVWDLHALILVSQPALFSVKELFQVEKESKKNLGQPGPLFADIPGPWLASETSKSLPAKAGFCCCQDRKVTVIFLWKGSVMDNMHRYVFMLGDLLTSTGNRRCRHTGQENILLSFGPGSQLHPW